MKPSRIGVLGVVVGLAAYVTGLQERVVGPLLERFRELDPNLQLGVVGVLALAGFTVAAVVARRRRADLAAAAQRIGGRFAGQP